MAALFTKLKKAFFLTAAGVLLLVVYLVDVAFRRSGDLDLGWIMFVRDILVIAAFVLFYVLIEQRWKRGQSPAKKLGFALVLSLMVGIASSVLFIVHSSGFEAKDYFLVPNGFDAISWADIYGITLGITMILVLLILRDIIFSKRRKETRRNFFILTGLIILNALASLTIRPLDSSTLTAALYILTIIAIVLNSFRLSWIVYLSKREKIFNIIYGFLLFVIFIGFSMLTSKGESIVGRSLLFYSRPLQSFANSVSLFAAIYFGMTFVSTLFHLPTAEAFDRKISEVSSLHNLGRLVTQVFDFNELVDSVTTMTLGVCEAKSAWLEIIPDKATPRRSTASEVQQTDSFNVVALKNISSEAVEEILGSMGESIRGSILTNRKPIVIDSVRRDKRMQNLNRDSKYTFDSIAIVPLISHESVIGILYATKEVEFGFDRDDVEVISAFADQATIAIENSRLIEKSLERERLMREMMLAQDMQRKLLPQSVPALPEIEIEALSTPAFEVGGDYYDFAMLDDHHLGILVGDVSGKGVSAAFYMAEMKGIFQSLSKIYREPREFLARAHRSLAGSIDRRSFISLIYGVLDLHTGTMTIARAGHCPMLYSTQGKVEYVKPTGLGLGMGSAEFFERTISQQRVQFDCGDVAVFYTDGVTEARAQDGAEFGYEQLQSVIRGVSNKSAVEIRDAIIDAVDRHTNHESPEDDLTIVVVKWVKEQTARTIGETA